MRGLRGAKRTTRSPCCSVPSARSIGSASKFGELAARRLSPAPAALDAASASRGTQFWRLEVLAADNTQRVLEPAGYACRTTHGHRVDPARRSPRARPRPGATAEQRAAD